MHTLSLLDKILGRKEGGNFYFKEFSNRDEKYSFDIPQEWKVVDISNDYGYIFSDKDRKQGVLTVRSISSLFYKLEKFADNLIIGMRKRNKYMLVSKRELVVNEMSAVEIVFRADAFVNGKRADAAIITIILQHEQTAKFYIMSYSVLQKDMNKYALIYIRARDTFKINF